ncbi:hypothetical protein CLV60_13030 [Dyadobacter jiangsuensis]|uniref:Uncharacterized protein n=1 Tax=Dyadobacter jiangsuensis TaxID=1591085 RepID=A0A2P8FA64_9BACT|nr:hypothetical protein CLV60_13030 [Dyadobacter jiangsuensis]
MAMYYYFLYLLLDILAGFISDDLHTRHFKLSEGIALSLVIET